MTETREQMEARHAREIAEWEAREVDWEAWRPALEAYYAGDPAFACCQVNMEEEDKNTIRGLIAAAPLMPVQAMGEDAAKALDQAGQWFGEYAISHAAKGATEKAHRNAERAQFCFDAALRAHMTAAGADQ
jgi:hypothetical protein